MPFFWPTPCPFFSLWETLHNLEISPLQTTAIKLYVQYASGFSRLSDKIPFGDAGVVEGNVDVVDCVVVSPLSQFIRSS